MALARDRAVAQLFAATRAEFGRIRSNWLARLVAPRSTLAYAKQIRREASESVALAKEIAADAIAEVKARESVN